MKTTHWMGDLEEIQRLEAENAQLRAEVKMAKEQFDKQQTETLRLGLESDQLRAENAQAAEAFELLAHKFPTIQVDAKDPIEAAKTINEQHEQLRAQCDSMLKEQLLRDREIARLRAEVERLKETPTREKQECITRLVKERDQWREDAERLMEAFDSCWGCVDGCDCVRCQAIAAHYALIKGKP